MTKQKVFVLATLGVVSGRSELEVEVFVTRLKYAERLKEIELAIINKEYEPAATNLVHSDDLTTGNIAPTAIKVVPSESAVGLGLIRSFMESRNFKLLGGTSIDFRLHLTGDNVRDFISQFCNQTYLRVNQGGAKEGVNANFDGDTTSEVSSPATKASTVTHNSDNDKADYERRIKTKTLVNVIAVRGVLNGIVTDVVTITTGKRNAVLNHESAIKEVDEGRVASNALAIYNTQRLNAFDIELTSVLTRAVISEEITLGYVRKVIAEHYGSSSVLETGDSNGFVMVLTGDDVAITDKLTGITDFVRELKSYPEARKPVLDDLRYFMHNMKIPEVYVKLQEEADAKSERPISDREDVRGSREHTAELDSHYIKEGTTRDERNNRFDPYVDEREEVDLGTARFSDRDNHPSDDPYFHDNDARDRYLDDRPGRGRVPGRRYRGEHLNERGCSHCDTVDKYHCHNRNCPQLCDAESRNRFTHSRSLQREDFVTRERRVQREMVTTKLENYPFLTMGNTGQVDVTPDFCVGVNTDADVIIDGFNISIPFSQVLAGKEVEGDTPRYWVQEGKLYMGKDGMFKMPKSARRAWGTNHGVVINCASGDYTLVVYLHGELIGITGLGIAELTATLSEYISNGYPIAFNHKDHLVVVVEDNDTPPPSRTDERLNW